MEKMCMTGRTCVLQSDGLFNIPNSSGGKRTLKPCPFIPILF